MAKAKEKTFDAQWIENELISLIGDRAQIKFSEAVKRVETEISYFDLLEVVSKSPKLEITGTGKSKLLTLTVKEEKPEKPDGTFWLPIDAIAEAAEFQPRGWDWQDEKGIDIDVVEQYAEWLEFSEPPPVEVWQGEIRGSESYWLLAGHHRIRALKSRDREKVECFSKARSYEEAIYRASISNAGGDTRSRQIFKMNSREWGQACRSFLRVCDRLPNDAIADFLAQAKGITGNSKTWTKINDSAIAAVFGVSRASVSNYKRQIDFQKAIADIGLEVGDRVLVEAPIERQYRLGDMMRIDQSFVICDWDSVRVNPHIPNRITEIDDLTRLTKVDDPKITRPQFQLKVGDTLWSKKGKCAVVEIKSDFDWESKYGYISTRTPLVMWLDPPHRGEHEVVREFNDDGRRQFDILPEENLLTIAERIKALRERSDDQTAQKQADYLESLEVPDLTPPESPIAPNSTDTPASVEEEIADTRERLLGSRSPAGEDGAELPDFPPNESEPPDSEPPLADRDRVMESTIKKAIAHLGMNIKFASNDQLMALKNILEAEITLRKM